MKSGVLYLYGGIWEEGEKDFKLRGTVGIIYFHFVAHISGSVRFDHFTFYGRLILKTDPWSYFRKR